MSPRWRAQTNLAAHPRWLGGVLRAVTAREARLVGDERLSLPAGASLVAACCARSHVSAMAFAPWRDRYLVFGAPYHR